MKKFFLSLAVFVMALCANAQTNQYFWYNGNLMMGNPIAQIDSVTFGEGEPADTLHILLPRTIIKEVHDTVYITIHDTVCPNEETFHNGYRYVDLGLSVMWADANVGAENPEDYGSYFAWGEIEQKDYYGFYNYKYGYYKTMSKYCMDSDHGTIDGLATLLPEDDAATVNMGGTWRIPSAEEWEELINNCIITEDTVNTHPGYRFTASNMKSIFIPRSGSIWGDREAALSDPNGNLERSIFYWTADLDPNYSAGAHVILNFEYNISGEVPPYINLWDRHVGGSVRGVFSKP